MSASDSEDDVSEATTGIDEPVIREISAMKGEPSWMLRLRLEAFRRFQSRPMPTWGADLSMIEGAEIALDPIVPDLGHRGGSGGSDAGSGPLPAGRTHQAGRASQRDAEGVYRRNSETLRAQGVLFTDMDTALRSYPEIVGSYFAKVVPPGDNTFAALNTSLWSGGSFVYVPPGVEVELPLQARVRGSGEQVGRFERTLIVADEGSSVSFIEGCSAPIYTPDALRAGVVEIVVKSNARVCYTTIQNWSTNVVNLVTKRAYVAAEGHMDWIDANIGSRLTMSCPAVWLAGPKATGEVSSVAFAGRGQQQDVGARMRHLAPETTSTVRSMSISRAGGRASSRSLVRVEEHAIGCTSTIRSNGLILDDESSSDLAPTLEIEARGATIDSDVTVSSIAAEQLFYLQSRGLSEEQAMGMVINGLIEPITRRLPLEYAVEWRRLIELQVEGSLG